MSESDYIYCSICGYRYNFMIIPDADDCPSCAGKVNPDLDQQVMDSEDFFYDN